MAFPLTAGTFEAGKGVFLLDGEPFVVKAAELHYPRIPRPYWEHRIEMAKALGMNTVCMYVFWNIHEPREGEFDFTGQNDIAEFVRLADRHGMKVIVRPGPYVCAEWEMGGLPWWLLRKKDIELRHRDAYYMERVRRFEHEVARQLSPYTIDKGGPVIMVQVENEYGAYDTDRAYVAEIRDMLRGEWGDGVEYFQCDWSSNFENNGLDDLLWTMNFGTGADVDGQFARLKELRPDAPLMCSEYWSGWFDKWGANHETRPADEMAAGLEEFLDKGISFSLYMTHGGTSFGHWAGANSPGFAPDVTSYDYDAPINEWGDTTAKYHKLREMMQRHSAEPLPAVPPLPMPVVTVPQFELNEYAPLGNGVDSVVGSEGVLPFELLGMGWGCAVYSTVMPEVEAGGVLTLHDGHDYVSVYLGDSLAGTIDRVRHQDSLTLPHVAAGTRLNLLVEAMGRINFGQAIKDYKGITDSVTVGDADGRTSRRLEGWTTYLIPDDYAVTQRAFARGTTMATGAPGYYRGTFSVDSVGDTFLDLSTWGKGQVWVNSHPLGRFWYIGPQQTLYLPGCWLKEGENEIVVLDILGPENRVACGLDAPVIDQVRDNRSAGGQSMPRPDIETLIPVADVTLPGENGWARVTFDAPAHGRYLAIEIPSTNAGDGYAAIAEIYALDGNGARLSREPWTAGYASSENRGGNRTLDKLYDLQESTYWESDSREGTPHLIVVDMGGERALSGIELLPRVEPGAPGAPTRLRIYCY